LPLDSHEIPDGGIFYIMPAGNQVGVNISGIAPILVEAGTPTQLGILYGTRILREVDDTSFTTTASDGRTITGIRRPNIILMTDGEPTFGWTNYRFDGHIFSNNGEYTSLASDVYSFDAGDALEHQGLGISLLTVLTASYMKERVHERYVGVESVGFYTIGLNITDFTSAALDTFGSAPGGGVNADLVNQVYAGVTYNMRDLLDRFSAEADVPVSFPVFNTAPYPQTPNPQYFLHTVTNPGENESKRLENIA